LVAAYEKEYRPVGKSKPKPVEVLREFVWEHRLKVRELGALLGVSDSAASMILKGDRNLTLDHVRKLAERLNVTTALFVGWIFNNAKGRCQTLFGA
jgi:HTH-type transcriptional regulator/antitoxin HigA